MTDNYITQYAGHILREGFRLKDKVQIQILFHVTSDLLIRFQFFFQHLISYSQLVFSAV